MPFQSGLEHIVREDEPLAPYTWLRLGGSAQFFAEPTTVDELAELARRCHADDMPVHLMGGGSNLLVHDQGVSGLVIHLTAPVFCDITVSQQRLTAGGGAKLSHLISTSVREGLGGFESLVGIPGTVGGALHSNASCHGSDIGHCTRSATVLTHSGEIISRERTDLLFAYRESSLDELVILQAHFELDQSDPQELTKRMQKLWIVNKAAQPMRDQATAMLFKDPGGISAATLIEQAGLQGSYVGSVALCERNANYVLVEPGGQAVHVLQLIDQLREGVAQQLGVELETAIDIW